VATSCPRIQIVIPVFRHGAATRRCVESVLASDLPAGTALTLINDASPEAAVRAYCREVAVHPAVTLIENAHNSGFVAAANQGFAGRAGRDVLLLNSDTEVAGDWLQRLRDAACRDSTTATATPFSNNATICSYPVPLSTNDLPPHWSLAQLDGLFRCANRGATATIPTAVGFCMYIRDAALEALGGFDLDNFGHGYGEECDFSMRARDRGWTHALAADVFVYHQGGASFQSESGQRKQQADETMRRLHPGYDNDVRHFILTDPLAPLRHRVNHLRMQQRPADSSRVHDEMADYCALLLQRCRESAAAGDDNLARLRQALERAVWLEECAEGRERDRAQLQAEMATLQRDYAALQDSLSQSRTAMDALRQRLDEREHEAATLRHRGDDLAAQLDKARQRLAQQDRSLDGASQRAAELETRIRQMETSRSWRYTAWLTGGHFQPAADR